MWLTLSGTAAKPLAESCGSASRKLIVVDIATVTSGKRIKESSPPISTRRSAKTAERRHTSNGGTNTLRQRLGRFVRKSLSFSKSEEMHEVCLRLFLHSYNLALISYD